MSSLDTRDFFDHDSSSEPESERELQEWNCYLEDKHVGDKSWRKKGDTVGFIRGLLLWYYHGTRAVQD